MLLSCFWECCHRPTLFHFVRISPPLSCFGSYPSLVSVATAPALFAGVSFPVCLCLCRFFPGAPPLRGSVAGDFSSELPGFNLSMYSVRRIHLPSLIDSGEVVAPSVLPLSSRRTEYSVTISSLSPSPALRAPPPVAHRPLLSSLQSSAQVYGGISFLWRRLLCGPATSCAFFCRPRRVSVLPTLYPFCVFPHCALVPWLCVPFNISPILLKRRFTSQHLRVYYFEFFTLCRISSVRIYWLLVSPDASSLLRGPGGGSS